MATQDEGSPYQGELFPHSYCVIYCPFDDCDLESPFKKPSDLLKHLECEHKTHIPNSNALLPFLDDYLDTLKCEGLFKSSSNEDEQVQFWNERDAGIRSALQKKKLEEMLQWQAKERAELYSKPRQCLFCLEYSLSHKALFSHMFKEHGFNIGLLDNLVMVEDFLRKLDGILAKKVCIFCHNEFRSNSCLRKHMKNKFHHRIDPKNHFYDKYYIVNYVKCGALGNDSSEKEFQDEEEADNWDDLDETVDLRTTCLFCEQVFPSPGQDFLKHMMNAHGFDLESIRQDFSVGKFYDYIKLITYIRYQIKELRCPTCQASFEHRPELEAHMGVENHCNIPEQDLWDQPQYLFPIFDDDPLLFYEDSIAGFE